jgi:methylenetetrahydrofolate reductase (NADPH)
MSSRHDADLKVSFEFFPPADAKGEARLWDTVHKLAPLAPEWLSVTYGAGGSTQERTDRIVRRILNETDQVPAAHLTCVGQTRDEVRERARGWWQAGVRHIVALRGDPPKGETFYRPHPDGFANAAELTAALKEIAPFDISVGGYPEVHPNSESLAADMANLKAKIDAGATRIITQYCFNTDDFLAFRDRCVAHGIEVPIVPGIMPVFNFTKVKRFSEGCGAGIPQWLEDTFAGLDEEPETRALVAASVAADQCTRMRAEGVHQFHFYTLNKPELTYAVCRRLGVKPALEEAA